MAITANNICLQGIVDISTVVTNNPKTANLRPEGLLAALETPINAVGIDDLVVTRLGKDFTVHVKYFDQECGGVEEGVPNVCLPGEDADVSAKFYTLPNKKYLYKKHTFSREDFRTICETWGTGTNANNITGDRNTTVGRKLIELAKEVIKYERDYYLSQIYLNLGAYADGVSSNPALGGEKTLKLFNDSDNMKPNALGLFPIKKNYSLMGYSNLSQAILVGGSQIEAWGEARGIFAGNNEGHDVGRVGSVIPFIDYTVAEYIQNTLGLAGERVLSWVPSHNQAVRYFLNEGQFTDNRPTLYSDTIVIEGQKFDISISTPDCGSVNITLGRGNALFNVGSISQATCDGKPSTLNWAVDCGALDCEVVSQPIANS